MAASLGADFDSPLDLQLRVLPIHPGARKPDLVFIAARFERAGSGQILVITESLYGFDAIAAQDELGSQILAHKGVGHAGWKLDAGHGTRPVVPRDGIFWARNLDDLGCQAHVVDLDDFMTVRFSRIARASRAEKWK